MLPSGKPKTTREPTTAVWNGNGGTEVERMRRARSHGGNGLRVSLARGSTQNKRDTLRPLRTHWSVCVAPLGCALFALAFGSAGVALTPRARADTSNRDEDIFGVHVRMHRSGLLTTTCAYLCREITWNRSSDRGFPPRTRI
jgi:hypothetical protein